jgi:hypothetical protein
VEQCHDAHLCIGDLKPENMLVDVATTTAGASPHVLLCDMEGFMELPKVTLGPYVVLC